MKKVVKIFIALVIAMPIFFHTFEKDNVISAKTLNDLYQELEDLKSQAADNDNKVQSTNAEIEANRAAITLAGEEVVAKTEEIDQNVNAIYELEQEIEIKGEEIADLMVYYQVNDVANDEIQFIVNSDSITETIHRTTVTGTLTEKSDEKITEYMAVQDELEAANVTLEEDIVELEALKVAYKAEIDKLNVNLESLQEMRVNIDDLIVNVEDTIAYFEELGCERDEDVDVCKERVSAVVPNAGGFTSPMEEGFITSNYGFYSPFGYPMFHTGIDMASNVNTTIYVSAPGVVGPVGYDGVRGNYAYVYHTVNGVKYTTYYGHMAVPSYLSTGQNVNVNDVVGVMGGTGAATGPHLHFEIQQGWFGIDFYWHAEAALDARGFLNYPPVGVYWSGRNR